MCTSNHHLALYFCSLHDIKGHFVVTALIFKDHAAPTWVILDDKLMCNGAQIAHIVDPARHLCLAIFC